MRFRLVKTGKSYMYPKTELWDAEGTISPELEMSPSVAQGEPAITHEEYNRMVFPITSEIGNMHLLRFDVVWKQAEAVRLNAQLTGIPDIDCYVQQKILGLEHDVECLRRQLAEIKED